MYPVHPHQIITDQQFDELVTNGFLILNEYIRGDELKTLQEAQRRCLDTYEQHKATGSKETSVLKPYPPKDLTMAALYRHPELIKLGKRFLKTDHVHFRVGCMIARYPGFQSGDTGHIDNGNNSLLPMSETAREFGQLGYWIHLDEVGLDQAPLMLGKKQDGKDTSKATPFACPAGSIAIFSNFTWHASSTYKRADGQRFTWGFGLGRADHPFEGFVHYSMIGWDKVWREMISQCTAEERTMFRFPPPNHYYYTKQTLAALEEQYPGWNARGEYAPVD